MIRHVVLVIGIAAIHGAAFAGPPDTEARLARAVETYRAQLDGERLQAFDEAHAAWHAYRQAHCRFRDTMAAQTYEVCMELQARLRVEEVQASSTIGAWGPSAANVEYRL